MTIKKTSLGILFFAISGCSSNEIVQRNIEFTNITSTLEETSGIAYLPKELEPFTGIYKKYYPSGKKEQETSYKSGKKNGMSTAWLENGQRTFSKNYKEGKEVGLKTEPLKQVQKDPESPAYNTDRPTTTAPIDNNGVAYLPNETKPFTGKYESYYPNGQKAIETNYKDGKISGLKTAWFKNGQIMYETNFKNGKIDGLCNHWTDDGIKTDVKNYKNGVYDGLLIAWDAKGIKRRETNYKDGKRNGLETIWYENGNKGSETNYKDDKEDGIEIIWNENGVESGKISYKYGAVQQIGANAPKAIHPTDTNISNAPTEILGLSLDAPFNLHECPLDTNLPTAHYASYLKKPSLPCWKHNVDEYAGRPLSDKGQYVGIESGEAPPGMEEGYGGFVLKGKLIKISIGTYGLDVQEAIYHQLISKYGEPTKKSTSMVQTRVGASFEKITAIWNFSNLTVNFIGIESNIDHGSISVDTLESTRHFEAIDRQNALIRPKL